MTISRLEHRQQNDPPSTVELENIQKHLTKSQTQNTEVVAFLKGKIFLIYKAQNWNISDITDVFHIGSRKIADSIAWTQLLAKYPQLAHIHTGRHTISTRNSQEHIVNFFKENPTIERYFANCDGK